MADTPQYMVVFTYDDERVIADDFPNSDLPFVQNQAKELQEVSRKDLGGAYRVAELRYVDEED